MIITCSHVITNDRILLLTWVSSVPLWLCITFSVLFIKWIDTWVVPFLGYWEHSYSKHGNTRVSMTNHSHFSCIYVQEWGSLISTPYLNAHFSGYGSLSCQDFSSSTVTISLHSLLICNTSSGMLQIGKSVFMSYLFRCFSSTMNPLHT